MTMQPRTVLDYINTKENKENNKNNSNNPYTTKEHELKNTVINIDMDANDMKQLSNKNGGTDRIQSAINNGINMGLGRGALLGFPVQNIAVNITDIRLHGKFFYFLLFSFSFHLKEKIWFEIIPKNI